MTAEKCTVTTIVRQGDALLPILFNIALDSVLRKVLQSERQALDIVQGKQIVVVAYADDIILLAHTGYSLKKTTDNLIDAARKIGLMSIKTKQNV